MPQDDNRPAEPLRDDLDQTVGPVLVEFGASWCGHCRALAPVLESELDAHREVRHVKIEDGPGRRLGRSFGVTLWPTLVFLQNGRIVKQMARPRAEEVREAMTALVGQANASSDL